jgi:hypothetical protein
LPIWRSFRSSVTLNNQLPIPATCKKEAQNFVAGLISVPIQNNTNFDIGPFGRNHVLNIQPVIPVNISHDWNLIIRWITPIVWQPAPGTANLEYTESWKIHRPISRRRMCKPTQACSDLET